MLKLILVIILSLPLSCFADSLMCGQPKSGGYGCNGKYEAKNNNGVEVFTCEDGKKILFSFSLCYVRLD